MDFKPVYIQAKEPGWRQVLTKFKRSECGKSHTDITALCRFIRKINKAAGRYFPLGLGYIASYLRHYGQHDVQLYEMEAQQLHYEDIAKILQVNQPDFIGLTCSTPNYFRAIELAKICRKHSKARIVLGGVHASALPEYIIDTSSEWIDFVVRGEGEIVMLELINACRNNTGISAIKGITYKENGKTVSNPDRPFNEDLDSIPFPARDLIPSHLFKPNLYNARYKESCTILTSRGCPFNCSFCASRVISGRKYRMHSAEYVIEEMEMIKKTYHAKHLVITDDTFTLNRERLEKICRLMIARKLGFKWFCFSQTNTIDREILSLMKEAGCYSMAFGIESGNRETLIKIGKPIDPERVLETVKSANALGLKTQGCYVFGTHGETKAQMENTAAFSKKVGTTLAFFNMLVPYPGTSEFKNYFPSIPTRDFDWSNFVAVGEKCVLKNSTVPASEIENLLAKTYFEYYSNPLRLLRIIYHIRTWREFFNYFQAALGLLAQIVSWNKKKGSSKE